MEEYLALVGTCASAVLAGQLPPAEALKRLASKTLGYGIVAGASVVKLPQVINVVSSGSAEGLAASSFEVEQLAYMVTILYSYGRGMPFSAYGESSLLILQNAVLLALVYFHTRANKVVAFLKAAVFAGVLAAGLTGSLPSGAVASAYDLSLVLILAARLPQIFKAFRERSTGQLSSVTTAANFLGGLARVFTSVADKGGSSMVRQYALASALNGLILGQILYFGDAAARRKKAAKKAN